MTRSFSKLPDAARKEFRIAQSRNAAEAKGYMATLVAVDEGVTKTFTSARVDEDSESIAMVMFTERPGAGSTKQQNERIRAILFANDAGDHFYSVWNLNKKRWKGRMRRSMKKAAKAFASG